MAVVKEITEGEGGEIAMWNKIKAMFKRREHTPFPIKCSLGEEFLLGGEVYVISGYRMEGARYGVKVNIEMVPQLNYRAKIWASNEIRRRDAKP